MRAKLINETYGFERGANPLKNLNIGLRQQIIDWLDSMEITNYTINDDLTIDGKNVDISHKSLTHFPKFIKFKHVDGNFYCHDNSLISLEGCPSSVGGKFYCHDNSKKFTEEYVRSLCNVKGYIYV